MRKNKTLPLAALVILIAAAGYWFWSNGRTGTANGPKPVPPVPVTVARASLGEMPILLDVVGRAEAYESVALKSRVDGQVASVSYREGQPVRKGDVLLQLDPGDFNARAMQAEANLARSEAQHAKSRADVERYVALKGRGFVSEEKVNEVRTGETAAAATARADRAALELARLQLSYATVRAPISGVVGARLVFPGSAVKINDTVLAVINRVQPLYVNFSLPERHLPQLRKAMGTGPLTVQVRLPGSKEPVFEGTTRFIDNAVDPATGTILMKAILENKDERLTAGQFLNVSMMLDKLDNAVLVPAEAVQQGAEGNFLYAVTAEGSVEVRKIEVLASHRGMVAIGKGVRADETVVTDGQLRLSPGANITVKSAEPKAAVASPAKPAGG